MHLGSLFLYFTLSVVTVNSARILAWIPTPSISHQVVFRPLTQELAKRGHEVVVITTDPVFPPGKAPENLTEIDLHDMSYSAWREEMMSSRMTTGNKDNSLTQMEIMLKLHPTIVGKQWDSKEVQSVIANKTSDFDLLILEPCARPTFGLSHILKIPLIMFSSFGGIGRVYDVVGAPSRPWLLYPTPFRQKINNLSVKERLAQVFYQYTYEHLFESAEVYENQIARRMFGEDLPDLREMEKNMDLLFLNVNPLWDLNRPVPPGVVYLGGIHQKAKKELPKVFTDF